MREQRPSPNLRTSRYEPAGRSGDSARACVKRALEAVRDALTRDPAASVSLPVMASAAGVSSRTLQRHLTCVLGASPHSVVQRLRLDAARNSLLAGEASSVLDAA